MRRQIISALQIAALVFCASAALLPLSAHADNTGLVAYWKFDEGTSTVATDFSSNGNTGTLLGSPTWASGKRGRALSFDGVGAYVSTATQINNPTPFTVAAWFKTTSASGHKIVGFEDAQTGTGGTSYDRHLYVGTDGKLYFGWFANSVITVSSAATVTDGQWHLAVGKFESGTGELYLDGVSQGTNSGGNGIAQNFAGYWRIGSYRLASWTNASDGYFPGSIDDVRIYNRALSAAEIAKLYNSGASLYKPPNNLGLVGYWSFDDATSTKATDFSGNGNVGTLSGSNLPAWVSGKKGNALNFNGTDSYVDAGNASSLDIPTGGSVTMCAWVYDTTGSVGGFQGLLAKRGSNYAYGINFITNNFQVYTSGASGIQAFTYNLPAQQWTHICGVISGSPTALYVNGALFGTAGSGGGVSSITDHLWIGSSNAATEIFNGKVDDVRIYNRALSASEIAALYGSGSVKFTSSSKTLSQGTTLTSGLVGLWTFDGQNLKWNADSDATIYDASGNNNNATTTNISRRTNVDGGKLGQAFTFNGSNNFIGGLGNFGLQNASKSIALWFKTSATGGIMVFQDDGAIVGGSTSSFVPTLYVGNDAKLYGEFWGSITNTIYSSANVNDGQWHHAALTASVGVGNVVTLYLDGVAASSTTSWGPNEGWWTATWIGGGNGSARAALNATWDYFNGALDDVRIYNRALTAAEVKQLYQLGQVRIR